MGAGGGDRQPGSRGRLTFNPGFLRARGRPPGGRGDLGPRPASRPDLRRIVNGEMPCAALADEIRAGAVRGACSCGSGTRAGDPGHRRSARRSAAGRARRDRGPPVADDRRGHPRAAGRRPLRARRRSYGLPAGEPFLRCAPAVVEPLGERRPQWWMFAELGRRMGLPLFGSARRDAELADGDVDDEVIAASISGQARRPWAEVRAAPYGVRDDVGGPGWLVPGRLPRLLDLAPTELVAEFSGAGRAASPGRRARARQPAHAQRSTTRCTARCGRGRPRSRRCSCIPKMPRTAEPRDGRRRRDASGERVMPSRGRGDGRDRRGVVSFPHGFDEANVNLVTSTRRRPAERDDRRQRLRGRRAAVDPSGQRTRLTPRAAPPWRSCRRSPEGGRRMSCKHRAIRSVQRRARVRARNSCRRSHLHRGLRRDGRADPRGT